MWRKFIIYTVLLLGAVVYVYPLLWLLINSLKSTPEIFSNPWGLPKEWVWSNYLQAWTTGKTSYFLKNSAIVTGVTLTVVLVLSSMAGFALTKLKWKASKTTMVYFLLGMMVPIHATLIPLFVYFSKIGLINSQWGLIMIYIAFGLPTAILVMSGFLRGIPNELLEASVIDGSSIYGAFWRIILPVSKSALMTVLILSFVHIWNELLVALVFISDDRKLTLPVGLTRFSDQYTTDYAPMFAAVLIATIPTVFLFSIFNKRVMAGMAEGAIKG